MKTTQLETLVALSDAASSLANKLYVASKGTQYSRLCGDAFQKMFDIEFLLRKTLHEQFPGECPCEECKKRREHHA